MNRYARGDEVSGFCTKMYANRFKLFKATGKQALAERHTHLLAKLESGSG